MDTTCPIKKCIKCSVVLDDTNWFPVRRKKNYKICKKCCYDMNRPSDLKRRIRRREYLLTQNYQHKYLKRDKARQILGGICQLCGTDEKLTFAHIVYTYPRNRNKTSSYSTAKEVIEFPHNFLLLCFNCHMRPEKYLKELIDIKSKNHGPLL